MLLSCEKTKRIVHFRPPDVSQGLRGSRRDFVCPDVTGEANDHDLLEQREHKWREIMRCRMRPGKYPGRSQISCVAKLLKPSVTSGPEMSIRRPQGTPTWRNWPWYVAPYSFRHLLLSDASVLPLPASRVPHLFCRFVPPKTTKSAANSGTDCDSPWTHLTDAPETSFLNPPQLSRAICSWNAAMGSYKNNDRSTAASWMISPRWSSLQYIGRVRYAQEDGAGLRQRPKRFPVQQHR